MSQSELVLADKVMQRLERLGQITEEPGQLTRTFLSPAMRSAVDQVAEWGRDLNMGVRLDNIGNLIGRFAAENPNAPVLLLGSHLDTVPNAGKFDGALGVVLALACVEKLRKDNTRLPFHLDVIGFSEEEGIRYQAPYLGSSVAAGTFDQRWLLLRDRQGISISDAIREFGGDPALLGNDRYRSESLVAYCEVHIEQGPVLEAHAHPVGIVTAIAGQTRASVQFQGRAGHAGTTPMNLRRDALCGAAEFVLFVESCARSRHELLATVGTMQVPQSAGNVIPGRAIVSLDVRHVEDSARRRACRELYDKALAIGEARNLEVFWQEVSDNDSTVCSESLKGLLSQACRNVSASFMLLPSGAGHDAVSMAAVTEAAMLFVRCRAGISHHPDECVSIEDMATAISVMNEFISLLAKDFTTEAQRTQGKF
ncbi:MAG TPA: allantoate amidohydrolase [Acidobacteriota bacterium]|jgi:allantoate deiminase